MCAGYVESIGLSGSYATSLREKAAELGVEMTWCGDRVKHGRGALEASSAISLPSARK